MSDNAGGHYFKATTPAHLLAIIAKIDAAEARVVRGIFADKESVLQQSVKDMAALKDLFKHDAKSFLAQQHCRDALDLDVGMVMQLAKHFERWQGIFGDFYDAAHSSHRDIRKEIDKHTAKYEAVLQMVEGTDYKKTGEMQDLEVSIKVLVCRNQAVDSQRLNKKLADKHREECEKTLANRKLDIRIKVHREKQELMKKLEINKEKVMDALSSLLITKHKELSE